MKALWFLLLLACLTYYSCDGPQEAGQSESALTEQSENPPAEGFNVEASDAKAVEIADQVMEALGGRENWDETDILSWNFFGRRHLVWDKQDGDVRVETGDGDIYLFNVHEDGKGQAKVGGQVLSHPDSLSKYLTRGKSIWINDSYWLVMPYKLKDSGVTLKYVGKDTTQAGRKADVLQLTFENVGRTPQNKYLVYVDEETKLVTQWDFFRNASDEEAAFSTPWANYRKYGAILLSGDRGQRQLSDIAVHQQLPDSVFTSLTPMDFSL